MRYIKMTAMIVVMAAAGMLSLQEAEARSVYVRETVVHHQGGQGMHPGRGHGYGHGQGHGGWGRGNYRPANYCPPRHRGYYTPAYYQPYYGGGYRHRSGGHHHGGGRGGTYINVRF